MRLVDDHSEGIGLSSKCQGYTRYKLFPFHYNLLIFLKGPPNVCISILI